MHRRPLLGGNWKMHLVPDGALRLAEGLLAGSEAFGVMDAVVFPSHPLLPGVFALLSGSPIAVGGQDLHPEPAGAYTGDVAGEQLAACGCSWVLCGHSERRHGHGESDELVGRKVEAALRAALVPMICVGETLEEKRQGRTEEVVERQTRTALAAITGSNSPSVDFAIAYEPVWAIGSGETATPEVAEEVHAFLRDMLSRLLSGPRAAGTRIVYGGSVRPKNAEELAAQPDIDGFLVGGASLKAEDFLSIARCIGTVAGRDA